MHAIVIFGKQYLLGLQMKFEDMIKNSPYPLSSRQIYSERHLFHGPRLQCISGGIIISESGFVGELTLLPVEDCFNLSHTPQLLTAPNFNDGIGQLIGLWAMEHGMYPFPVGLEKLEIYRPSPPPGTRVPVRARLVQESAKKLSADIEVQDGRGAVWMRCKGWKEWIFRWPANLVDFRRFPNKHTIAEDLSLPFLPPGATGQALCRSALKDFSLSLIARHYLSMEEMTKFKNLSAYPGRQAQWLLGRVAVKDAVRLWLAKRESSDMVHPASFAVTADDAGQPRVTGLGNGAHPCISISHCDDSYAVAVAGSKSIGIDVERIRTRNKEFPSFFTTRREIQMLERVPSASYDEWITRLWCAKEAVGKFLGTGVKGAPQQLEAVGIENDGKISILHKGNGLLSSVHTLRRDDLIIAVAGDQTAPS
jgi:phosphopantetheinyl transferase